LINDGNKETFRVRRVSFFLVEPYVMIDNMLLYEYTKVKCHKFLHLFERTGKPGRQKYSKKYSIMELNKKKGGEPPC